MNQTIRFTRSADGVRLAYAESGRGPPIVKAANWLSHLEFDWQSPVWRHWFSFFSGRNRLIRYDQRGCGLSDWEASDLSIAAQVNDLEAVVDAAGVEPFVLVGMSQGGCVAVEYALRHPERVARLVLYGAFARGWNRRDDGTERRSRALNELIRFGWGQDNPAFRKLFATIFIPQASSEQERWFSDLMRISSQPEIAARLREAHGEMYVADRLDALRVPTLVMHARDESCIPFAEGRILASGIRDAHFVALESRNHILLESEPAWTRFCAEFSHFTGRDVPGATSVPDSARLGQLSEREHMILAHLARGLRNSEIASRLFISEKTVRNHMTSIFGKLDVDSRAQAIVLAHQSAPRDARADRTIVPALALGK